MYLFLTSLALLVLSCLVPLPFSRQPRRANLYGTVLLILANIFGLITTVKTLLTGKNLVLWLPWKLPYASLAIKLDPLSAFFAFIIFIISSLAAIYGVGYLQSEAEKKNIGTTTSLFNLLTLSMLVVVLASNAILFLFAWEVMALSSFGLVMFHDEKESVRRAGWNYLVASQVGVAFLIICFALLAGRVHSFDFDQFALIPGTAPLSFVGICFFFALVGFGTKAGIVPLHTWLPEAHPVAPSHVSALMSGVMVKMGIYGMVRMVFLLSPLPSWTAWVLIALGLVSGVYALIFALAQHHLKKALAYSTIENVGIILLGLGLGILGQQQAMPLVAFLCWAGVFFHVANHAVFKTLLFFGAGVVIHQTGETDVNRLGGLLKRMPRTGFAVLSACLAAAALPPLCGFFSEFLIYWGSFKSLFFMKGSALLGITTVIVGLALMGGIALAVFTKIFGGVFLGEARVETRHTTSDPSKSLLVPMMGLAILCLILGFCSPVVINVFSTILSPQLGLSTVTAGQEVVQPVLIALVVASTIFLVLVVVLYFSKKKLLKKRVVNAHLTWDCGYTLPTARMQYTGSSFVWPLAFLFRGVLGTQQTKTLPQGFFPATAEMKTESADVIGRSVFAMISQGLMKRALWLRRIQHGNLQMYILYIVITLLVLFVWRFL